MFRKISCLFDLYLFSRELARFDCQSVLKGLPVEFLNLKKTKKRQKNLPPTPEERLSVFLNNAGICEQTAASFFALFPDIVGRYGADLLARATNSLENHAKSTDLKDQKRFLNILKVFYTFAGRNPDLKSTAEQFEQILGYNFDFRFEAAALERLHDHFYEDDFCRVALPDWKNTHKHILTLSDEPSCKELSASSDKKKTAVNLAKTVVLMILRDGFVVMPSKGVCKVDENANLFLTRARTPVAFSDQERVFISSFLHALTRKDYPQAAKALLTSGQIPSFFSPARLINLIEQTDRHASLLLPGQKADCFLKSFADNGIRLPFSVRYCVMALKRTEELCQNVLNVHGNIWEETVCEFSDFLEKGKNSPSGAKADPTDIQTAFGLDPHHAERLAFQNKKLPSFQEDLQKIPEILHRHTIAARFQNKRHHTVVKILFLCFLSLSIGLFMFLK